MLIDGHNHIGTELLFYLHGDYPYGQDILTLVERGDSHGVTHWIVFPFVTNLTFDLRALHSGQVAVSDGIESTPYAFENRRLMNEVYNYFPEHADRMLPFAIIDPAREAEAQISALRNLKNDYPLFGLKIQATIIQSHITELAGSGHGFLELAREWDLPFIIHSSIAENDLWSQASDILDIAEAHPDIRFCLAHSCRFDRTALDRLAQLPNTWFDCSAHVIHCLSVQRGYPNVSSGDRLFPSDYGDPGQVLADLYASYPDKLIWGSDSPFYSWVTTEGRFPCTLKSTYQTETDCLNALTEDACKAVTENNTLNMLGSTVAV